MDLVSYTVRESLCGYCITRTDYNTAPARDAVHYETVTFDGYFVIESPFTGEPRPELDDAWHNLLRSKRPFLAGEPLANQHLQTPISECQQIL